MLSNSTSYDVLILSRILENRFLSVMILGTNKVSSTGFAAMASHWATQPHNMLPWPPTEPQPCDRPQVEPGYTASQYAAMASHWAPVMWQASGGTWQHSLTICCHGLPLSPSHVTGLRWNLATQPHNMLPWPPTEPQSCDRPQVEPGYTASQHAAMASHWAPVMWQASGGTYLHSLTTHCWSCDQLLVISTSLHTIQREQDLRIYLAARILQLTPNKSNQ